MARKLSWLLLSSLLLFAFAFAKAKQGTQPRVYAFTHITLIDGTGASAKPDMTVVVIGDRIVAIDKAGDVLIPENAKVVDGTGKFLIPGLWDMHTHPFLIPEILPPDLLFKMYLANGVTGLRDPSGPLNLQLKWRKAVQAGELLGPRMYVSGPILDGPSPMWTSAVIPVTNATDARLTVSKLKAQGSDFIKVYDFVPRDAYFAIADEAKKEHMPFVGHIPYSVTALEASAAGQKSIEHILHLFEACSCNELELQKEALKDIAEASARGMQESLQTLFSKLFRIEFKAMRNYDKQKAQTLFARFVRNDTYVDPTLVGFTFERGDFDLSDARLRYIPDPLKESWKPGNYLLSKSFTPQDYADAKTINRKRVKLVGIMRRAKVKLLAGTDSPTVAYSFAGFSLHDELALLVTAGLTPMEALQTTTRNPAEFFGILHSLGTIEKGKIADMVLLDANPLVDIHNTQRINAVMIGGRLLDRAMLDSMLAEVEAKVREK
jgi:hypothetical protein